ncbi:DEAD/DEAH box helicase family protein [Pararhodobacter sp. SW119]|uniref:DEAD/DEAH box helicase family protein n=1 Tax=Pararhodobacter sp. SW119 TaxID=2780075 RepID=UPI001ADEE504|nr:DEAD/DEAH box helicase family protein [Pararhodobacter sp. SW119]
MRTLDYQVRVLDTLDAYLDELKSRKAEADQIDAVRAANPNLPIPAMDFTEATWARMQAAGRLPPSRVAIPFSPRKDGCARPVPNVTLKVPTGGGKTWLAVNAVSRIMGRYLAKNTGFVLWIVPNEAIYTQTLKRLKDRQHPYRQALDRAAAGRVRIMEKSDRLDARDVETHLCVMILMLQAANRQTQETLRMFRDRGDVHGFFPPEGDQAAHAAEFQAVPNLDGYDRDFWPHVKDSLGNPGRFKTAEQNDLNQPENQDLLSPTNRVRVIITKAALQEGWDCPFAYVLCSLAAASNLSAMTQLVGRILRQPHALKTGVPALDECYIITHHAETGAVVNAIKTGLEKDGLADLVIEVPPGAGPAGTGAARKIERRDTLRTLQIYLPKVLRVDGDGLRDLDYETDILAAIDWRDYDPREVARAIPDNPRQAASQLQRISLTDSGREHFRGETIGTGTEALRFDASYAVRVVSDLIPNPFVARDVVGKLLSQLEARGFDEAKLGAAAGVIVDTLRLALDKERTRRAEGLFKDDVRAGRIQFRLRVAGPNWQMPDHIWTTEPEQSPVLRSATDEPLTRSLFSPVLRNELNTDERGVAVHLDGDGAVKWWHRNVAKTNYGLQGWKRGRIYPDFIFAAGGNAGADRIVILETKGDHLQNPDTDYKQAVLQFLSDSFSWDQAVPAGQLQITMTGETVECALVLMEDVPTQLPRLIQGHGQRRLD